MSNENADVIDPLLSAVTSDLRVDDLKVTSEPAKFPFVKPKVHVEGADLSALTLEQTIAIAKLVEEQTRKHVEQARYDAKASGQVIKKDVVPITDFSQLTLDDVYDLSVPIEAKAMMSADVLAIKLKDTNYEARWVNVNPQRLGEMIGKGFTYIEPKDLIEVEGIQTGVDAQGHYRFNDVVAMKIDKATYYRALRAAHERAVQTTDTANSRKRAISAANGFMEQSNIGSDFQSARANGTMKFYDPGVEA